MSTGFPNFGYVYQEVTDSELPAAAGFSLETSRSARTYDIHNTDTPLNYEVLRNIPIDILGTTITGGPSLGYSPGPPSTSSGTASTIPYLNRLLPMTDPVYPYLYAAAISRIWGRGVDPETYITNTPLSPVLNSADSVNEYSQASTYRIQIEFLPRPYGVYADSVVSAGQTNSTWVDASGLVQNYTYVPEWQRYSDYDISAINDFVVSDRGNFVFRGGVQRTGTLNMNSFVINDIDSTGLTMNMLVSSSYLPFGTRITAIIGTGPGSQVFISNPPNQLSLNDLVTFYFGSSGVGGQVFTGKPRIPIPNQLVKLTWFQVPWRYITSPNSYLFRWVGRVNQNAFMNTDWGPGQLLYLGMTPKKYLAPTYFNTALEQDVVINDTKSANAGPGDYTPLNWPKLCDIEFNFLYTSRKLAPLDSNSSGVNLSVPTNGNWIPYGHNILPSFQDMRFHYATSYNPFDGASPQGTNPAYWVPPFLSFPFEIMFTDPDYIQPTPNINSKPWNVGQPITWD